MDFYFLMEIKPFKEKMEAVDYFAKQVGIIGPIVDTLNIKVDIDIYNEKTYIGHTLVIKPFIKVIPSSDIEALELQMTIQLLRSISEFLGMQFHIRRDKPIEPTQIPQ